MAACDTSGQPELGTSRARDPRPASDAGESVPQGAFQPSENDAGTAKELVCGTWALPVTDSALEVETCPASTGARQFGETGSDHLSAVTVDAEGAVYATGSTRGLLGETNAGNADAFIRKYDAEGEVLWTKQFGTQMNEGGTDIAVDPNGNIYVSGYTSGSLQISSLGEADAFLRKTDGLGDEIWTRQFGSVGEDVAFGLTLESDAAIYVVGDTEGSLGGNHAGGTDAFISKFDAQGELMWSSQIGSSGQDDFRAVALTSAGTVVSVGRTSGTLGDSNLGGSDALVRHMDADANELWIRQIGTAAWDDAHGVVVDAADHLYVAGNTDGTVEGEFLRSDGYVSRLDGEGNIQWTERFGTPEHDFVPAIAIDVSGNLVVAGDTQGSLQGVNAGGRDVFVRVLDATGEELWTRQFGSSEDDNTYGVATGPASVAYVVGSTYGNLQGRPAGGSDAFIVQLVQP